MYRFLGNRIHSLDQSRGRNYLLHTTPTMTSYDSYRLQLMTRSHRPYSPTPSPPRLIPALRAG